MVSGCHDDPTYLDIEMDDNRDWASASFMIRRDLPLQSMVAF
jgi:hypothetical protein